MTTHINSLRQLEFMVGYRLSQAQRRFESDAKNATASFLNNDELSAIKADVRKMKKV